METPKKKSHRRYIADPQRSVDAEDDLLLGNKFFGGTGGKYFVYLGYKITLWH